MKWKDIVFNAEWKSLKRPRCVQTDKLDKIVEDEADELLDAQPVAEFGL